MRLKDISVPDVYKSSADFRFFLKWFELCLSQIQYDTENILDLYDPLRCKTNLLWMLADTMGFKYDDRQYPSFNRLVLLYFMSMIRSRGSQDGMLVAGQVNLASKTIYDKTKDDSIYEDRLYSDVLPANSVSVTSNPSEGYIDMVYFTDSLPVDTCVEYVRPIGMYCCQTPGVKYDARTRISVDPRLVDDIDSIYPPGPARISDYSKDDYSALQGYDGQTLKSRQLSYYRNSNYERTPTVDAGYRTLYSLQVCNPENVMHSALQGNNQADEVLGVNWVDTGVSLNQLRDEFSWGIPQPETIYSDTSEVESDEIISIPNNNMGSLGDSLS